MVQTDRQRIEAAEVEFYSSYYEQEIWNRYGWDLRMRRELRSLLQAYGADQLDTVLSVGCGAGEFELLLAAKARRVVAIDLSPEAIDLARRRAKEAGITNVEFECRPMAELKWEGGFDAVVCLAFLHHVPEAELESFMRESRAHLRPGGLFYSQDPNVRGVLRAIGRMVMGKGYDKYHTPDERELDPSQIAGTLRAAGFEQVRVGYIDLTLIPLSLMFPKAPKAFMKLCQWVDWAWCHSPLARWASGFRTSSRNPAATVPNGVRP